MNIFLYWRGPSAYIPVATLFPGDLVYYHPSDATYAREAFFPRLHLEQREQDHVQSVAEEAGLSVEEIHIIALPES
jgi:hypothetical protein